MQSMPASTAQTGLQSHTGDDVVCSGDGVVCSGDGVVCSGDDVLRSGEGVDVCGLDYELRSCHIWHWANEVCI